MAKMVRKASQRVALQIFNCIANAEWKEVCETSRSLRLSHQGNTSGKLNRAP